MTAVWNKGSMAGATVLDPLFFSIFMILLGLFGFAMVTILDGGILDSKTSFINHLFGLTRYRNGYSKKRI